MKEKIEISEMFCEMLTSLEHKCVICKQTNTAESESEVFSKSEIFGLGLGLGRPKSSAFQSCF
jgi:hypothetical protein